MWVLLAAVVALNPCGGVVTFASMFGLNLWFLDWFAPLFLVILL